MSPALVLSLWTGAAFAQEDPEPAPVETPAPGLVPEAPAPEEAPAEAPEAPTGAVPAEPAPDAAAAAAAAEAAAAEAAAAATAAATAEAAAPHEPFSMGYDRPPPLLRYALSFEAGALANHDPSYDLFAQGDIMGSIGASGELRISRNLAIRAGWQRVNRGATVEVYLPDTDADFETDYQLLVAALTAHQATAGLKLDVPIAEYLRPYVSGQAMVVVTQIRLDDDPSVRDNPGQVQQLGLTTGGMLTFGAELRAPVTDTFQPAVYLEMGPSLLAPTDLGEMGTMRMGGFVLRTGVGVRF